jgi:uncharacterized repeat protein (TIGR03843 family)
MAINTDQAIDLLKNSKMELEGEFVWGSNYTFLAQLEHEGEKFAAVYKPMRGERPLWDFPSASLARREVAAFVVSEALGWGLVPPTILRDDAPMGPGSVQLFIEHNPEYHYFNFTETDRQRLRPVVVFDILINNADRKGSHVLKDAEGHLWLIDHGVCFHVEEKLRTVIWDFVGQPVPENLCADVTQFSQALIHKGEEMTPLAAQLRPLLSVGEIKALKRRADQLVNSGRFPAPDPYRRPFPWPQI